MLTNVEHDVIEKLKSGIDKVANAVKSTLGPAGNNVMIETLSGPIITKDGVTVAKSISLEEKTENLAASLVKKIATLTVEQAGDGTTTSTILAQSLFNEGCKLLKYTTNKIALKNEIISNIERVVKKLNDKTEIIELDQEGENKRLEQVATISANGDVEMGKTIVEAFKLVGKSGIISVEDNYENGYKVEKTEGLQIDCGFSNPYFMTDTTKLECEFMNAKIMIYKGPLTSVKPIENIINYVIKNGLPLVIFAEDFSDMFQQILIKNKLQGTIQICLCKIPGWGQTRENTYDDISAVTGAFQFNKGDDTLKFEPKETLGEVSKIIINRNVSKIIASDTLDKTKFNEIILKIQTMISETANRTEIERLNERLGKLVGGVAIIKVGGSTDVEIHEKKDRIDDAVCATRAALEEGILPGGGSTLYRIANSLEDDGTEGFKIVREALKSPIKTLCENCGLSYEYIDALLTSQNHINAGIDFSKGNYELVDLINQGIIDPTKVARVALETASSIVGLLLTTNYTITIAEKIDQEALV